MQLENSNIDMQLATKTVKIKMYPRNRWHRSLGEQQTL